MSRLSGSFKGFSPLLPGKASPFPLKGSRNCFQLSSTSVAGPFSRSFWGPLAPSYFCSLSLNPVGKGSPLHSLWSSSPQGQDSLFIGFPNSSGLSLKGFSSNYAGLIFNTFNISSFLELPSFKSNDTLIAT
jgi:hypothetical protein